MRQSLIINILNMMYIYLYIIIIHFHRTFHQKSVHEVELKALQKDRSDTELQFPR